MASVAAVEASSFRRSCEVCSGSSFDRIFEKDGHTFVRCATCSFERIDPQPTDEVLARIYGDHYYDAWGLRRNEERVARLKKATFSDLFESLPAPAPGARLLDCGAATGFLLEVAKERGWEPYAVEFSDFGVAELRRKFGESRVFQGELESARFEDAGEGAFRVVTMCDFIEHVRDPRRVLTRARELIAPGGVLAITTPDAGSFSHAALRSGWAHYKIEHLYYFRKDNLKKLLQACGFTHVEYRPLTKSLSVSYIREMYEVYPHPVLSRAARLAGLALPESLQGRRLRLKTGEMFAIAS
jgi:2-polyprenyl-3-methyl-5-hydroxy-6-metoxy-1,4-benzoquinol methylase